MYCLKVIDMNCCIYFIIMNLIQTVYFIFYFKYHQTAIQRAKLEMERRFMSNKHPTQTFDEQGVTQSEVNWSNRVLACAYMDPRLCLKQDVMSTKLWRKARSLFKTEYIHFYTTAKAYKRELVAQSEKTNKEKEEIEEDETGQNKVNNSTNRLVNLDDDSSDDENEADDTLFMHQSEQTIQSSDKQDATTEVEKVCKDWQAFIRTHCNDKCLYDLYKNESESLPELSGNDAHYKAIDDLLKLEIKPLMNKINEVNKTCKNCFGYLPLMMGASKCQLGAVNSESYSERINSAANQVVTKNVVSTDPDFVDKLVTLRMNEKFMAHVQKFKYKGKTNLIPDIENVINKSSDNLWMDDESLFEELIMSV